MYGYYELYVVSFLYVFIHSYLLEARVSIKFFIVIGKGICADNTIDESYWDFKPYPSYKKHIYNGNSDTFRLNLCVSIFTKLNFL